MKPHIFNSILAAVLLLAILPPVLVAAPQVFIYTDKGSYQAGETIEVCLAGDNYGEGINVDVYVGLVTPEGSPYTLGQLAWSNAIGPWIQNIYVPRQFNMDRTPFFWFPLPCEMPPIHQPGDFHFLAGLSHSGTFDFASAISAAPFEVVQVPRDYYVNAELGDDTNDGCQDAPWRTITHALDSVEGSGLAPVTIHVGAGTYQCRALEMKSWVSMIGEGADRTVLDGQQGPRWSVIYCLEVDHLSIEGFTITAGYAGYSHMDESGGCGGGICSYNSSPTISNNIIGGNTAKKEWGDLWGVSGGGGIYCELGFPTISNNIIRGNTSDTQDAGSGGGGICCYMSSATIVNNLISDNLVYTSMYGGGGGGILCYESSPVIVNNLVVDNYVTGGQGCGGGIYCYQNSSPTILANTICHNRLQCSWFADGVGIAAERDSFAEIIDCIVWNLYSHELYGSFGGECSTKYCCVQDAVPGEGNIHDDPMFVPGPLGDYYLQPDSPCVDAGSRSAEDAGLSEMTTQTDGTPDTGTVDMGVHYPVPLDSLMRTSLEFQE